MLVLAETLLRKKGLESKSIKLVYTDLLLHVMVFSVDVFSAKNVSFFVVLTFFQTSLQETHAIYAI